MKRRTLHSSLISALDKGISLILSKEILHQTPEHFRIFVTTPAYNVLLNGVPHELCKERINKDNLMPRVDWEYKGITVIEKNTQGGIKFALAICVKDYIPQWAGRIVCQLNKNGTVIGYWNYYAQSKASKTKGEIMAEPTTNIPKAHPKIVGQTKKGKTRVKKSERSVKK